MRNEGGWLCWARRWYDGSQQRGQGRPKTAADIAAIIVKMASENSWRYTRIKGALKNLGHEVGRNTIKRILQENGIDPAPERGNRMSWATFIKAHIGVIVGMDFFTVEAMTWLGLVRYHVLFALPAHSPNLNAFAERFVLSIKSECLERLVPLGESHLRLAIAEYMRHYHLERNHQGLANKLIDGGAQAVVGNGAVACRDRLGGLLKFYHREAA